MRLLHVFVAVTNLKMPHSYRRRVVQNDSIDDQGEQSHDRSRGMTSLLQMVDIDFLFFSMKLIII